MGLKSDAHFWQQTGRGANILVWLVSLLALHRLWLQPKSSTSVRIVLKLEFTHK